MYDPCAERVSLPEHCYTEGGKGWSLPEQDHLRKGDRTVGTIRTEAFRQRLQAFVDRRVVSKASEE